MRVNFVFSKLLVWFLVTVILSHEDDSGCRESKDGDVVWPETKPSTCVESSPVCIGENREILRRCCDEESHWGVSPQCRYYQDAVNSPCPDDLIANLAKKSCIFVIQHSTYPPECPYEDTLPFSEYVDHIDPAWLPVWMPVVRRGGNYGLDLLRWIEPTAEYKQTYTDKARYNNYHFFGSLKDKNCLVFHNSSYVEAVSCDETYTAVCAYKSLPERVRSFCAQSFPLPDVCAQSDYSTKSKCFCRGSNDVKSSHAKAEFLQPYQNFLYPSLSDEVCQIGLTRNSEDRYVWSNSDAIVNYTYWAANVTFGKQYKYGAISLDGWSLMQTESENKCALYEVELPMVEGEIILQYEEQVNNFFVNITHPKSWLWYETGAVPMIFCFTDAASASLITRMIVDILTIATGYVMYSFEPHSDGPGTYWCEAFRYPDIVSVSSNEFLLRYTDGHREEYAVILKTNYTKGTNPLTDTNIQFFRNLLSDQIPSFPDVSTFVTRIYKIVDVDEENSEITINFHVTNPADSDPLKLYSPLRGYLEQNLAQFTFINVLGVDSCVGIQTVEDEHVATWSITNINEVALKPREGFCVKTDGSIMTRRCYGDYINGARWSDLEEPCNIQESTNTTMNLTNIVALNDPKEFVSQVAELTTNYTDLTPLDIHLISKFLEQLASGDSVDQTVMEIMNQLMNVSEEVLRESQTQFNATDRILHCADQIIIKSKFVGELTGENFLLISSYIKDSNLSGIVLKLHNDITTTIQKIFNLFDLDDIKTIENLYAAVVMSQSLLDHIYLTQESDSRIVVVVYKNSKLFSEGTATHKNASMIMGVLLPDLEGNFSGEISTIYNKSGVANNFDCSFWSYDLDVKKGSWEKDAPRSDGQSAIFCKYNHLTHLALVQKEEFSITSELERILSSSTSLSEKLANASGILSSYYEDFQPIDVMLISSLLHEASLGSEDNVDLVADIVNGVMDIPTEVLEKSQAMYNATGKILSYFDEILQQFGSSKTIMKDNLYAVVQFLKDGDVHGFILNNCASKCNFTLLQAVPSDLEISLIENLDTAMIVSQELLDQLRHVEDANYTPKIVTVVFFGDSLFIEDYADSKITATVTGVFLPNFDKSFDGNIKLLYNLNAYITSNYTCSVYYNDSNDTTYEKGFWIADNPPIPVNNYLQCQFWKPKYFALVYSLFNASLVLENILKSQDAIEVVLQETDDIVSNYYAHLQAFDVFVIAQLLSRVTDVNNLLVEICLNIVSNVMKVPKDILKGSQEKYNATNLIVDYFNKIAQNHDVSKAMFKDNIVVIVSLLSESGMLGITFENCKKQCEVTLLYGTSADSDTIHFDTELIIGQSLIDQLLYHQGDGYVPKLVLTVYYNDALFNADNGDKATGKIFGVSLPMFEPLLWHEIKIYINVSTGEAGSYDCASWNYKESDWDYKSKARGLGSLSCNFYQQSYFTFIAGDTGYDNVTSALTELRNSSVYFSEKLYKSEDISYYYSDFASVDVHLLAEILSQCDWLPTDGLDRLGVIINNVLRISDRVLAAAQYYYKVYNQLLNNIITIAGFEQSYEQSSIEDQSFSLVVCQVNSTENNSVIATPTEVRCASNFDATNLTSNEDALAIVVLSKDLLDRVIVSEGYQTVIATVFSNDIFFSTKEASNKSIIVGVSVPQLEEEFEGGITVLFNVRSYKSDFDCAYWNYGTNSWNFTDDKTEVGLFRRCNYKESTYFAIVETGNKPGADNVTEVLRRICEGDFPVSEKLNRTFDAILAFTDVLEAVDVYYVAQILSRLTGVELADLKLIADITNVIMNIPRDILIDSQVRYNATDWLLHHIDRIAQEFDDVADVETDNFALIIANNITGISIEDCRIRILNEDVDVASLKGDHNFSTALVLDEELRGQLSESSSKIFVTVYFTDALFNEGYNKTYSNIGQIIGIAIPTIDQSLKGPLKFYYYTNNNKTDFCAFWNYTIEDEDVVSGRWEKDKTPLQPSKVSLCESELTTHFALLQGVNNVTSDLEDILKSNSTMKEKLKQVLGITLDVPKKLSAVDIYLISEILNYVVGEVGSDEMNLTAHIISRLFHVKRDVLRMSQLKYYATDKILQSIDDIASQEDELVGDLIVYENFVVASYDLKGTNTSGLVLQYCDSTMCDISLLENSVNLTELGENENLETAIVLSDELLEQVRRSEGAGKLVVTIFFSDVLFNEQSEGDTETTMICGVLLPGFEAALAGNVYVMFNTAKGVDNNNSCAYWNYKVVEHESIVEGSWKSDAGPRSSDRFQICEFDHITHFALLLANDDSSYIDANTFHLLDIITAVNCSLSVVGIFGIMLTAALFERWRKNTGNQILLNFAIAISIKIVMLYVSVQVYASHAEGVLCSVTGAILHFAMLSEFCWMLIIAILQFKRFVEVLGGPPKYVLLKACVCGWVFPTLPVMLILLIDTDNYSEGQVGLCYPSGLGLYLGIWLPLIIIVAINFVIFFFIIYNVFHKKTETRDLVNHEILFQWRLALLLFSMLGLTWTFGFLSQIQGAYIFVYLFCFTATLQGFVMFLFFIVFNQSTRFLYSQSIKLWLYSRGYKVQ